MYTSKFTLSHRKDMLKVGIYLQVFLISTPDGVTWSVSSLAALFLAKKRTEPKEYEAGWTSHRVSKQW
jgi:hypothetical protein